MNDHYKVSIPKQKPYTFTTGTKTKEECLAWIKEQFDYLPFYSVELNGVKVGEKIKNENSN